LSSRTDQDWILDILAHGNRVREFSKISQTTYREDIIFDAILYNLICLGEAVRMLSSELKALHKGILWQRITGLRNRLTHEYFQLSPEHINDVIAEYLEPFLEQCQQLLKQNE